VDGLVMAGQSVEGRNLSARHLVLRRITPPPQDVEHWERTEKGLTFGLVNYNKPAGYDKIITSVHSDTNQTGLQAASLHSRMLVGFLDASQRFSGTT